MTRAVNSKSMPVAGATMALVLLTALNFVNYIDRYLIFPVEGLVQKEFGVSDSQLGSLTLWFFIAYMFAAPLTGWMGDRYKRKPLIVGGAIFFSTITLLTATVHSFAALMIRHAALGVGEASFGIFGAAVLADFYPARERNRVLTIFYIAIPVGAAIGYGMGGWLGQAHGWRFPFYVNAVPGLIVAGLIWLLMKEPVRGGSESKTTAIAKTRVMGLFVNPAYLFAVLGMAMVVFSLGGISAWVPLFLNRFGGYSVAQAGLMVGGVTAVSGLLGTVVGGWAAHRWLKKNYRALYLISAWSALLGVAPAVLAFFGPRWAMLPGIGVSLFCIMLGSGPLNAAIVNSVGAAIRSTAIAVELFAIHALGDMPSPKLIGMVSDASNLRIGLALTLVTLLIASGVLFLGAKHAPPLPESKPA